MKKKKKIKKRIPKKRKIKVISRRNGQDKSIDLQKIIGSQFQTLSKTYEKFKAKRKKEKEKEEKLKSKNREKQNKEEQRQLKNEEKLLKKEEEERLREISFIRIEKERKVREEQEERERLDPIYKDSIAKAEQEKLTQLEEVTKLKEKRIVDEQQKQEKIDQNYKEKLEKIEQEKLTQLEEITKLSEKMMQEEIRDFREKNRNLNSPTLLMIEEEMVSELVIQNSVYITLKTQYEEAKIEEVAKTPMIQIIDGPIKPVKMTSPKPAITILLSVFLGFILTFISVYLREFSQRIESEETISIGA